MRFALLATLLALTAGCSLTPTQKKWAAIGAGVLIVGAVIAHQDDDNGAGRALDDPSMPCRPQPDGSCR
jgi:hypothetical protein